ncbi:MAG: hypothetical protein E2O65_12400 [Gammaproteobacteria bacterium]|nr:MAG: hypothetical protein E2O65_12400 [Gammaproteobacteria bacterium]
MSDLDPAYATATELARLIRRRQISLVEVIGENRHLRFVFSTLIDPRFDPHADTQPALNGIPIDSKY